MHRTPWNVQIAFLLMIFIAGNRRVKCQTKARSTNRMYNFEQKSLVRRFPYIFYHVNHAQ